MTITPGIVLADGEQITTDKLNQLGTPTVALDDGDVTSIAANLDDLLAVARRNYFTNPGLDQWTRGTGPVTCATGARQELANDWWVRCNATTSGSPTYSRVTSPNEKWIYAAKITGATGVGSCDFGQDLPPHVAAALSPKITVTFDLFNGTGAAVTPEVRLDTCDTSESYGTVTNRVSVTAGTSVANSALETITVTLDVEAYQTQLRNGAQLYIRIPSPALSSGSAYVQIHAPKVEIGDTATSRYVERDQTPVVDSGSSGGMLGRWLRNGDFAQWPTNSVTCPEDEQTYAAEGWSVNPADGSSLVYARNTSVPGTGAVYSAQLTGGADVTAQVDFAQEIVAAVAGNLRRLLVFSVEIYNGTGADFQPVLRLDTCDAVNDFSTVTNRVSTTASTCTNGQWTRVEFSFDGESVTNITNGAKLIVRFPGGSLDSSGKLVRIAEAQLEEGSAATEWDVQPIVLPRTVTALTRGLQMSGFSSTIDINVDEAVLVEPSGGAILVTGLDRTLDIFSNGAGGLDTGSISTSVSNLYHIWLISTGVTHSTLLSLSATAPTMPQGYRYKARVGVARTTSAPALSQFTQRGGQVLLTPLTLFNAAVTAATTYQDISVDGYVPEYAATILLEVRGETSGQPMRCTLAVDTQEYAKQDLVAAANTNVVNGAYQSARVELPVMGSPVKFRFKAEATTVTYRINLLGYRLE